MDRNPNGDTSSKICIFLNIVTCESMIHNYRTVVGALHHRMDHDDLQPKLRHSRTLGETLFLMAYPLLELLVF